VLTVVVTTVKLQVETELLLMQAILQGEQVALVVQVMQELEVQVVEGVEHSLKQVVVSEAQERLNIDSYESPRNVFRKLLLLFPKSFIF
jgi:hypothetical protein